MDKYRSLYAEAWRERKREAHCCVVCGKQDERTLRGLTRCETCFQKDKAAKKKYREKLRNELKRDQETGSSGA